MPSRIVSLMLQVAVWLVLPFAALQLGLVLTRAVAAPFVSALAIPTGVLSLVLIQITLVYAAAKGWHACRMPAHYRWLGLWLGCVLVLYAVPRFMPLAGSGL
ncbi:hypothetical protein [Pseudomonas chlororaphis]|uniref:Uncharacterized protein n=2 Tax=Pseudomonas chlororaphis TaxID=587753 RepID=A0AAX3G1V6_9PSED|nr:hypothetical protein [Pseudomonas chlororaphis]AVO57428.1 hypothetical protein C6Q18_05420 [Pseudomonas chlororaphis subsp. piscium]AZC35538.1 hypothetical protein C4K37_1132 [Pseudomonas chlororaphis subsp. piscium]AZC42079.1 hypothetical protein C4K36_1135 [Pseudomonas chlororaphis subsp. piscium]AZC61628.1 hypothetical protein C4K33_1117 [Pseudomonas chlororaphis subsp. piscium]AZC67870.1 hypothetical protein C4K32_1189 [Pseudomonas chlororaphis subsp. piscium]